MARVRGTEKLMQQLGFGVADPDYDNFPDLKKIFIKHMDHKLSAARTGGADWSAEHVWSISNSKAKRLGLPVAPDAEIYLIWNEGDRAEPLVFISQTEEQVEEGEQPDELRDATLEDMLYLVGGR